MVAFYNQGDQNIYKDFQYVPQEQYRLGFKAPTSSEQKIEQTFGIPNTNAFTNSGGGALQVGDPMMNFDNFYNYTGNKYMMNQDRPNLDSYSDNAQKTFLGMPSYRQQELTGPDMGEYIGSGTNIPLEQTMAGKIQSGFQSTGKGITNLMGMLPTPSNLLNKFGIQNFSSLSPADQAFIQMNAGYTGPTIFGENTSGISKDPFGRNVESIGGNYAQKVRDDFDKLSTNLSPTGVIGKKDQYQGATFDPVTGTFTADDEDEASIAAAAYANKMNKMNLSKYRFDKKAIAQQNQNQKDIDKKAAVEANIAAAASRAESKRQYNPAVHGKNNYGLDSAGKQSYDTGQGFGSSSVDGGPVSNKTGRGRTGYFYGGLASIL